MRIGVDRVDNSRHSWSN
ncbi:UNVERIFIED_CONTAM: hypothetical protein GTU68_065131 [Idotea baltica]|nr:hypothetical protein [Idotea baltica]